MVGITKVLNEQESFKASSHQKAGSGRAQVITCGNFTQVIREPASSVGFSLPTLAKIKAVTEAARQTPEFHQSAAGEMDRTGQVRRRFSSIPKKDRAESAMPIRMRGQFCCGKERQGTRTDQHPDKFSGCSPGQAFDKVARALGIPWPALHENKKEGREKTRLVTSDPVSPMESGGGNFTPPAHGKTGDRVASAVGVSLAARHKIKVITETALGMGGNSCTMNLSRSGGA